MSKKSIKYLKPILIAIFSVWFINGCVDDNFDFNKLSKHIENESVWDFPIAKTTFVMEDLINTIDTTGFVEQDEDGLIMLVYSDTAYSATARESVIFPDQSYDTIFDEQDYQDAGGFNENGLVKMTKANINYLFIAAAANQLLDSIYIESSLLDISINSSFKYQGSVTLTFPELKKDGQSYQKVIPINDNSGNFSYNNTFDDLDGYMLDFTNFANPLENNFFITYEVELIESSGSGAVSPEATCDIDVGFKDIQYEYIWGYLGTQTLDIPVKEINLDFFSAFEGDQFELFDPRLIINVKNSFGLEVGVHFPTFEMKLQDDSWVDIEGPGVPTAENPWIFRSPFDSYPAALTPTDTTVKLTGSQTNLNELVSQLPKKMKFGEAVKLNPNETGEKTNFMSKNSKVDVTVNFEIPLWWRTSGITINDTMDLDIGSMTDQIDMIQYFDLNFEINNGFPHNLGVVAYLTDSLYNVIDSIPNTNDLPGGDTIWFARSGILGPDSVINQNTEKTLSSFTIRYDENVDKLDDVKYLLIKVKFITTEGDTPDAPYVKYFNFYGMDIKVSAGWKMNISEDL